MGQLLLLRMPAASSKLPERPGQTVVRGGPAETRLEAAIQCGSGSGDQVGEPHRATVAAIVPCAR